VALPERLLPGHLKLGATWKLILGVVFVLLVVFLRRGLAGASSTCGTWRGPGRQGGRCSRPTQASGAETAEMQVARKGTQTHEGPILQVTGLTKRYGGLLANSDIDFSVDHGEIRGIIGPNGAGKSTFFKMLTCEVQPTSGKIVFDGRDITGMGVIDACQQGLTKSYQINQLFEKLTVRQNLEIAALGELRGKFKLDLFKNLHKVGKLDAHVGGTAALVHLTERLDTQVSNWPTARSAGWKSAWRWPPPQACCCSTSRWPA
jgi:branched-chain amino acid transport system permease protein